MDESIFQIQSPHLMGTGNLSWLHSYRLMGFFLSSLTGLTMVTVILKSPSLRISDIFLISGRSLICPYQTVLQQIQFLRLDDGFSPFVYVQFVINVFKVCFDRIGRDEKFC